MSADSANSRPPALEFSSPEENACIGSPNAVSPKTGVRHGIARIPARFLVGLIRIYQCTLSPALPIITMGRCDCRFSPTCSHYAVEAIRVHGAGRGSLLAVVRLFKCTPLHPGGHDPVPTRFGPTCRRSALPSLTSQRSAH